MIKSIFLLTLATVFLISCVSPKCGDNVCEVWKLPSYNEFVSCPQDCGVKCGDGICTRSPDDEMNTCPQDCQNNPLPTKTATPSITQPYANDYISSLQSKYRPLVGGLRLEMKRTNGIAYCSLGSIVNLQGRNYILLASHCAATSSTSGVPSKNDIGLPVKQGGEQIGYVYKTADFTGGVDAALVYINDGINSELRDYSGNQINGFGTAYQGLRVYKIGASTGLTHGIISGTNIQFTGTDGKMYKAFEVRADNGGDFCQGGDSGSAVVTMDQPHKIVGILSSAGSDHCSSNMPEDIKASLGLN